jgi:nucleoside-diphosphate-sugar epimerase
MNEAVALAEEISGTTLSLERHADAAGDVRRTRADVSKAERELGWRPTTSLAEGLAAQWEWVAARVAAP